MNKILFTIMLVVFLSGSAWGWSDNDYPNEDKAKVGYISVTQAVNLDTIESDTATNTAKISYTGDSDTSATNEINTITGDDSNSTTGLGITIAGAGTVSTAVVGDTLTVTGTGDGTGTDDQAAAEVAVTTTNFGGIFANDNTSDTVQECLDLADDHNHSGVYEPADAAIVKSDEAETITANWVNTDNPWADNEVSDTLTASSCTGNAATVTNATLTTALTVNTGTVTLIGNVANTSALTLGAGASSVSGTNTGDEYNAITDNNTEPASSGNITVTLAQLKRGVLTDKSLTGAADFELDDEDDYLSARILIVDGTYVISLVPPSGEKLWMDGESLDANDEIDLSTDEGDKFALTRRYSAADSGYVWDIETVRGLQTDGGPSD